MNIDSATDIRVRIYNGGSRPWGAGGSNVQETDAIMDKITDQVWDLAMQVIARLRG